LAIHKKVNEKHVPATKKEDSGVVVLSESETESDDEVRVISVTPSKKTIELDMEDPYNDDDDKKECVDLTQPAFVMSTTFGERLTAYSTPEDHAHVHDANTFPKIPDEEPTHGDDRIRAGNARCQDNQRSLSPAPIAEDVNDDAAALDKLERLASPDPDEAYLSQFEDDMQNCKSSRGSIDSSIDSSTEISGHLSSLYPNLSTSITDSNSNSNSDTICRYGLGAIRSAKSRWDVGPTLATTVEIDDWPSNGMHEFRRMDSRLSPVYIPCSPSLPTFEDAVTPAAPTLPNPTLVGQSTKAAMSADMSKMSIRNIIAPVSKSTSPEPEVVAPAQADIPASHPDARIAKQDEELISYVSSTASKKRKVDDADNLSAESIRQDPAYALVTSTDLGTEELTPEALSSIRRKRPFTIKAMQASAKSVVRAWPLAERRAAKRLEMKKASKTAWMATVKPFLLGTLVGSVGVFGALLSLPDMK